MLIVLSNSLTVPKIMNSTAVNYCNVYFAMMLETIQCFHHGICRFLLESWVNTVYRLPRTVSISIYVFFLIAIHFDSELFELRKWKALREHSLHGKIAASVLLKLFISGNERYHTTNAPLAHEWTSIFKCKQHTINDSKGPENITTQWCSTDT